MRIVDGLVGCALTGFGSLLTFALIGGEMTVSPEWGIVFGWAWAAAMLWAGVRLFLYPR